MLSGLQKQAQPWQAYATPPLRHAPLARKEAGRRTGSPRPRAGLHAGACGGRGRAPGEQDVVRVVEVEPGAEDGERLHALACWRLKRVARHAGRRAGRARLRAVAVVHVKVQQRHAPHACARRALSARRTPPARPDARPYRRPGARPARQPGPVRSGSKKHFPEPILHRPHPPSSKCFFPPAGPARSRQACDAPAKAGRRRRAGARPPRGTWTPRTPRRWPGCSAGRSPGCRAGRSRRSRCPPGPRGAQAAAPRRTRCAPGARVLVGSPDSAASPQSHPGQGLCRRAGREAGLRSWDMQRVVCGLTVKCAALSAEEVAAAG